MPLTAEYDPITKMGEVVSYPMGAATTIYKGALVSVRSTGFAHPARSGTASDVFVGVAVETVANPGAAGERRIRVLKRGTFVYTGTGFSQASVGLAFYAADDNILTTTATNNQLVGYCVEFISSTLIRIRIDGAVR